MKIQRVRVDFSRYTDAGLVAKVQAIIQAMAANTAIFPDPNPQMTTIGTATTAYTVALAKAATRDKTLIALKEERRTELIRLLATLGAYVENIANGDEATISASGYDMVKPASTRPPIEAPQNFTLAAGVNSGEIVASFDRVSGALSYMYEIAPDPLTPGSTWQLQTSTSRKYTFTNLTPGQRYWFRVAAIGPRGQKVYGNGQIRMSL